jgi:electron transfer flavoprotein beta subunit
MGVAVLLKRVDLDVRVDPLTGVSERDPHGGMSVADRTALEAALRCAAREGAPLLAVTAGPADAEPVLREALAAGAARAVRVALPADADSRTVAEALAPVVRGCGWVWAGDASADRGSGSVPAFVAGLLGAAQALGLVAVELDPEVRAQLDERASRGVTASRGEQTGSGSSMATRILPAQDEPAAAPRPLRVERRLDGGRRELISAVAPVVLSVEGGVLSLRRASLPATLAAQRATIEVVEGPRADAPPASVARPYRPRARVLPGPDPRLSARERLLALSGALREHDPPRIVTAPPAEAADELLAFLRDRGHLA